MRALRLPIAVVLFFASACQTENTPRPIPTDVPPDETLSPLSFSAPGPVAGEAGAGSFTIGVSTAAAQIEEPSPVSDWYVYSMPEPEGIGRGTPIDQAVQGYSRVMDDLNLIESMQLDAYRVNVSWSRIEPERDVIDQDALDHYRAVLEALVAKGIKPMVTVHHFSSPNWIDDVRRRESCEELGVIPGDRDLCGWGEESGAMEVARELGEFAELLAAEYGDIVDEWCTLNEPVNYILASYGSDAFPPGRGSVLGLLSDNGTDRMMGTLENYVEGHVQAYDAIHRADTIDADGDGKAALVGLSLNTNDWSPVRDGALSDDPDDIKAAANVWYLYHHTIVDSLVDGNFDRNLDRESSPAESHPDWKGKIDWLGVQYYARLGVTGSVALLPAVDGLMCFEGLPLTEGCLSVPDPTKCVPEMSYEFYEPGLSKVLLDFHARWPGLPLTVTESGLATEVGRRRSEHIVRSLEQIVVAQQGGADIRGYYHWSLMDNYEWTYGWKPRFGLYSVNVLGEDYARVPTEAVDTLTEIASTRGVSLEMRTRMGGTGPMTEISNLATPVNEFCQHQR